jgi:hypothetical protein
LVCGAFNAAAEATPKPGTAKTATKRAVPKDLTRDNFIQPTSSQPLDFVPHVRLVDDALHTFNSCREWVLSSTAETTILLAGLAVGRREGSAFLHDRSPQIRP